MGAKQTRPSKGKPKPKPQSRLQNLAARPQAQVGDENVDEEQLVDHSGVFRVTTAIAQAQTGHDEERGLRFASESLVMQAQRDGFREDGPTMDDALDEHQVQDEASRAEKRARLATLVKRGQQLRRR
jgi:hypothetical protein